MRCSAAGASVTVCASFFTLKVTLQGVRPPIWRRIVVADSMTLFELHEVLQVVMGWEDCHLHDFSIGKTRQTVSNREARQAVDETRTRLSDVLEPKKKLLYQYDFGDGWVHEVVAEKALEGAPVAVPRCIDGARACPPEDSGGAWGYEEKLAIVADPKHEEYEEMLEWIGDDFDPEAFSVDAINERLEEMHAGARRRRR